MSQKTPCQNNDNYFIRNRSMYIEHTCKYHCHREAKCDLLFLYRIKKEYERKEIFEKSLESKTKQEIIHMMFKIQHDKYNDDIEKTHKDKQFIWLSDYIWKKYKV